MRRNNLIILIGTVTNFTERKAKLDDETILVTELLLKTDRPDITAEHRIMVRGRQAREFRCFVEASSPHLPELMVLGWLHSGDETLVVAERITFVAPHSTRKAAAQAIRQLRFAE